MELGAWEALLQLPPLRLPFLFARLEASGRDLTCMSAQTGDVLPVAHGHRKTLSTPSLQPD